MQKTVRRILLIGSAATFILLTLGALLFFAPSQFSSHGLLLINAAILVLFAVPLVRVLAITIGFAKYRNKTYFLLSITVLVMLSISFALGVG